MESRVALGDVRLTSMVHEHCGDAYTQAFNPTPYSYSDFLVDHSRQ